MIIPFDTTGKSREEITKGYLDLGFDTETADAYVAVLLGDTPVVKRTGTILPVEKAAELAIQVDHEEFREEVAKSIEAGVSFIKVDVTDDGDIEVSQPTGVMVAFMLPNWPSLEVRGGTEDPHITLAYLGDEADMSLTQKRTLVGVINEVAQRWEIMRGVVAGTDYFEQSEAWVAKVTVPGLEQLREDLVGTLEEAGIPVVQDYPFNPHITLAYTATIPAVDVAPFEICIDQISAVVGGYRSDAKLKEREYDGLETYEPLVPWSEQKQTPFVPIVKSVDEKRFTLAPMYIPGQYDAHGDWSTPDELQKALWDFNRSEDKTIALQHHPELGKMGEAVEMMVVPWEMDVPMVKADGSTQTVHFPADTPWLGVVWNEDVWPLIKKGLIRGYSIGGTASLLNIDLPEAAE